MVGLQKAITALCPSLDNEYVLASSLDQHKMVLYRTKTNTKLMQYTGHTDTINACLLNYGLKQAISCSNDRTVRYWDTLSAKQLRSDNCTSPVNNLDLSTSESLLISTHMNDVKVWSVNHGKVINAFVGIHADDITCAKFTPDE